MSRSRRKTAMCGVTTAESEKKAKRMANQRFRRRVKAAIQQGLEVMPHPYEVTNPYDLPKDGKQRFDPTEQPRLMRK